MQTDYFGPAVEAPVQAGVTRPRSSSPADLSPRKAAKRESGSPSPEGQDAANGGGDGGGNDHTAAGASGSAPNGPPFICPTCSTSYSRLEYLRRHERRHADIRPFVCDCGKGFSRSDVLSRHKRQCKTVLQIDGGGEDEAPNVEGGTPPKPAKARRSSAAKPGRPKGSTKAAAFSSGAAAPGGDGVGPPPPAPQQGEDPKLDSQQQQPPQSKQQQQQQDQHDPRLTEQPDVGVDHNRPDHQEPTPEENASAMIDPAIAADSHASAPASSAAATSGAVAAYGSYAPGMEPPQSEFSASRLPLYAPGTFGHTHAPVHSQVSALSHHYCQPSSPESSTSRSEHGSPRYTSQGLVRHGSNPGARFGLRGGGYEYSNARGLPAGSLSSTDAAIWEGLDTAKLPSPGNVGTAVARGGSSVFAGLGPGFPVTSPLSHLTDRTRTGGHLGSDASYFRSAGSGVGIGGYSSGNASSSGFSYPATSSSSVADASPASNATASHQTAASSLSQGQSEASGGATTPKEPIRFSVSTMGPLSPFSNTALNSSMSPYLSAFSNARDTPHVSSPRGGVPSTPGGGGSGLDLGGQWNGMRPPSRTISRHNSIHGLATSSSNTSPQSDGNLSNDNGQSQNAKAVAKSASSDRLNLSESSTRSTLNAGATDTSAADKGSAASVDSSRRQDQQQSSSNATAASAGSTGADSASTSRTDNGNGNGNTNGSSSGADSVAKTSAPSPGSGSSSSATVAATTRAAANTSGIDTPSRYIKDQSHQYFDGGALTPGPEAFLLRIQGGAQEMRAGINSMINTAVFGPSLSSTTAMRGSMAVGGGGSSSDGAAVPAFSASPPLWDPTVFASASANGLPSDAPMSVLNSALGWLMSPSIQQLLQAFPTTSSALSSHKDKTDDYFSVASTAPIAATATTATGGHAPGLSLDVEVSPSPLELALTDSKNPFFLPPNLFRPCYSIPHWNLPPLARLSMIALHAQQNLLKHFPVIHEPTFRLDTTPSCLAFAICMLGNHEAGRKWWAGEEVVPKTAMHVLNSLTQPPDTSRPDQRGDSGPSRYFDEEDGRELVKPIVMTEKTDMLMRTFAACCSSTRDRCSVVQALMLFQSNNFLSSDSPTRMVAAISHGSVVALARQSGLFDANEEHARREVAYTAQDVLAQFEDELAVCRFSHSMLPNYLPACPDDEKVWRKWCELEGRRRTAFVIYVMDTVAGLDAGIPTLLRIDEPDHLPLPSPDSIWRAPTAEAWRKALDVYKGPTLDEALQQLLGAEHKSPAPGNAVPGTSIYGAHGPFARLVTIVSLLRGITGMLEGRTQKVPRPSQLEKWMDRSRANSLGRTAADHQISCFRKALSRWRKSWDQDETCKTASSPAAAAAAAASAQQKRGGGGPPGDAGADQGFSNETLFTPLTASGATPLCDDALPLYWLSHVLVTHAASDQKLPLRSCASICEATGSAAAVSNGIDMPDFRSMLRFAKNFVTRGET